MWIRKGSRQSREIFPSEVRKKLEDLIKRFLNVIVQMLMKKKKIIINKICIIWNKPIWRVLRF